MNIPDAYGIPGDSPYRISHSFDEKSRYRTKSMLVVPMRDHNDEVIGVLPAGAHHEPLLGLRLAPRAQRARDCRADSDRSVAARRLRRRDVDRRAVADAR